MAHDTDTTPPAPFSLITGELVDQPEPDGESYLVLDDGSAGVTRRRDVLCTRCAKRIGEEPFIVDATRRWTHTRCSK